MREEEWVNKHCAGATEHDGADARGHLVSLAVDDGLRRRHRRAPANGSAGGDEHGQRRVQAERPAEQHAERQSRADGEQVREEPSRADAGDLLHGELDAVQHDAEAEEPRLGKSNARLGQRQLLLWPRGAQTHAHDRRPEQRRECRANGERVCRQRDAVRQRQAGKLRSHRRNFHRGR